MYVEYVAMFMMRQPKVCLQNSATIFCAQNVDATKMSMWRWKQPNRLLLSSKGSTINF